VKGGEELAELHEMLDRLYQEMGHDSDTSQRPANAAEAFAAKHGTSRDLSHIFIGASHALGIPARYVAGYYRREIPNGSDNSGHAWAEAFVTGLGWVAFDPANGFCPTDAHIRVATGLDSLGAAPMRGMRFGPGVETLAVAITVGQ
jgi:transglutaminase-like putative cysteine protease